MYKPRIEVVFGNERIISPSGLNIVGAMLGKSDFKKRCDRRKVDPKRSQPQIKDGDILLMHDIKQKTAIGTETFLREMTQMGFMFATVEELLYLRGYTIEPNLVYHSAYTPVMKEGLR